MGCVRSLRDRKEFQHCAAVVGDITDRQPIDDARCKSTDPAVPSNQVGPDSG